MTTELVDNALWHGEGEPLLDLDVGDTALVVGVTDRGAGTVRPASRYSWPETGHGLQLVTALADTWGVEPASGGPGKRVWFRITWAEPHPARALRRPKVLSVVRGDGD